MGRPGSFESSVLKCGTEMSICMLQNVSLFDLFFCVLGTFLVLPLVHTTQYFVGYVLLLSDSHVIVLNALYLMK